MKLRSAFRPKIALLAAASFLASCATVPETGRSALHLMPRGQLAAMALDQFEQLKTKETLSDNDRYNRMVREVGRNIADVVSHEMPNADWEFVVFKDDEQVNAFAMPGGKVAVYTGIFDVAKNADDLAVVMGHEVAHVVAGHGNERVSQRMAVAGGALALNYGTREMDPGERRLIMAAFGAGSTLGVLLPYSRLHEREADKLGLLYSARAGYDPRAAIGFWERMEAQKEVKIPEFLSTHPSGDTRIEKLREFMPEAMREYREAIGGGRSGTSPSRS